MTQTADDDQHLIASFRDAGQGHAFRWWEEIDQAGRARLLRQLRTIDLQQLASLIAGIKAGELTPKVPGEPEPADYIPLPRSSEEHRERQKARDAGEELLRAGRLAVLTAAGGQASRLDFDGPKGTYPIGAVSGKTLFHVRAERIMAAGRRYGRPVLWYIMTSHATDEATRAYFERENYFGLARENVQFFRQGAMPVLDLDFRLAMSARDEILFSPNGNGGALLALRDTGMLDDMAARGVETASYVQIDNCLVPGADPVLLGYHKLAGAQMSNKALAKRDPDEPVGAFARIDGRVVVVEYSDLTAEQKHRRRADGSLLYGLGSPAIHLFDVDFIRRETEGESRMPIHLAKKSAPCLDDTGRLVQPRGKNVYKFERFIFDAICDADPTLIFEFRREEEFYPVKQLVGPDSVETCRDAMTALYADWLEKAGVTVPRDDSGRPRHPIEISPLYALDAPELAAKVSPDLKTDAPLYLGPD